MKKCKKCETEFVPSKGLTSYCSLQCRNSRSWSEEDRKKKSIAAKASVRVMEQVERLKEENTGNRCYRHLTDEEYGRLRENRQIERNKKLLNADYSTLKFDSIRKRIKLEQNEACNKCGIDKWLGQKLTLELEHIDGNNKNNARENLEALCPNCHSLTETWRGRNNGKKKQDRVDDNALIKALLSGHESMSKALISVGMVPKGGNYKRCHRLLRELDGIRSPKNS